MSATEIIAAIKRLPQQEQEVVCEFVQQRRAAKPAKPTVRYAADATFDQALDRVLTTNAELFRKLAQ